MQEIPDGTGTQKLQAHPIWDLSYIKTDHTLRKHRHSNQRKEFIIFFPCQQSLAEMLSSHVVCLQSIPVTLISLGSYEQAESMEFHTWQITLIYSSTPAHARINVQTSSVFLFINKRAKESNCYNWKTELASKNWHEAIICVWVFHLGLHSSRRLAEQYDSIDVTRWLCIKVKMLSGV